jgi:hypothetical protein
MYPPPLHPRPLLQLADVRMSHDDIYASSPPRLFPSCVFLYNPYATPACVPIYSLYLCTLEILKTCASKNLFKHISGKIEEKTNNICSYVLVHTYVNRSIYICKGLIRGGQANRKSAKSWAQSAIANHQNLRCASSHIEIP